MLLEMDNSDIIHLLESQDDLHDKVQETMAVLQIQNSGYKCEYEKKNIYLSSEPPSWLLCIICQGLATEPTQANCCGNVYCNKCIQTWKQRSDTCPTCRSTPQSDPKFELFSDRNVRRQINNLVTLCSNASKGCDAKVELSQLEQHLNSKNGCEFQNTDCSYRCGKIIPRHRVPNHQRNECPLRPSTCKYCKIKSTHQEISGDHAQVCLLLPLPCPNKCGKEAIPRRDLPAHQGVCPREKVDCPFQQLGCKEKLLRKDLGGIGEED